MVGGLLALLLSATWASSNVPRLTVKDLQIDIPADILYGSLPPNRGLTVTVRVPEQPARQGEPLVAVFESETFPQYTVPFESLPEAHRLSATVDLGRLSSTMGTPPKATAIHVAIARQRGLHLEELARRSVVVTIATPGYADRSVRTETAGGALRLPDSTAREASPVSDLALLDGMVQEEDLLGNGNQNRQDGYWKQLQGLIRQRLRDEVVPPRRMAVRRMPVIHFRLYANGEAQLIEIERSSGDAELDQAALLSVVNAHPFPPFPAGSQESHVDVHVDLPPLTR